MASQSSSTAFATAMFRAAHVLLDAPPLIFHDQLAPAIVRMDAEDLRRGLEGGVAPSARMFAVTRSRVAEDEIERQARCGVRQCVVLGAGYDTTALRRGDLPLEFYEVDQAALQQEKRRIIGALSLEPTNVRFVEADFAVDSLIERLREAGLDSSNPSVWSWLGVTAYLPLETIEETLRAAADLSGPGSSLVVTFLLDRASMDDAGRAFDSLVSSAAAARGEPQVSRFSRLEFRDLVEKTGWIDIDLVTTESVSGWFASRSDGLLPIRYEEVLIAHR